MDDPGKDETTRRTFMVGGAAAAMGAAGAGRIRSGAISDERARLVDKLAAAGATTSASLSDVKHIVILMQENRSFDHYFGTLSGVRGFSDPAAGKNANGTPIFDQ
jgi:phospholipase C